MKDKKHRPFLRILNNRKGVSAILVAVLLPVLIGFGALAIDVGYMYATKNELQNIADSAALAGAGELGRIYLSLDPKDHKQFDVTNHLGTDYTPQIKNEATNVADLNKHANEESFTINESDISIGVWDWQLKQLDPPDPGNGKSADAVQVIARRDTSANNPVTTFFARIFSIFGGSHETFESSAVATAALSGMSVAKPGVLKAPIGISQNHPCYDSVTSPLVSTLQLHPTNESCAGWHNFFDLISSSSVGDKMISLIEGYSPSDNPTEGHDWLQTYFDINKAVDPEVTPTTSLGDEFSFQGGTINALFVSGGYYPNWFRDDLGGTPYPIPVQDPVTDAAEDNIKKPVPFINLFDFYRFRDGDGSGTDMVDFCGTTVKADEVWTTTMPVYEEEDAGCDNPNRTPFVVGFAEVMIRMPDMPVDDTVVICYACDGKIDPGRGGGGMFGNVKGAIPNLVE
jgi:hypothetical protein